MDVRDALMAHGGAARVKTLAATGLPPHRVRRAALRGLIVRAGRGIVAVPDAAPSAILAARLGAGHTCVTALERYGLPLPSIGTTPHLAVPRNFTTHARELAGARLHYTVEPVAPGRLSSVSAALDVAGACLNEEWHLVAVDAGLNRGLISARDIASFARTVRERRDFLLAHCDGRAESAGETLARLLLVQAGLAVRPQAHVTGVGRVDLEVEGVVIVEIDGFVHHSDARSFRRDRQRDRVVSTHGRPVLRYAAGELTGQWRPDIVGEVRRALAAWPARGGASATPRIY